MTTANITPAAASDGQVYAQAKALTSTEADVFNGVGASPVPILYESSVIAYVTFTAGPGAVGPSWVSLQGDLGDGLWADLAWCQWAGTSGSQTFVLVAGGYAAGGNVFQQTRPVNTAPGSSGFNPCNLPGRIRFVGRTGAGSSASPSPGPSPSPGVASMTVGIRYKLQGLR